VSTVARGPLQDWAFVSTEDERDTFNAGEADGKGRITPWRPYRQEIIAVNVITGETERLAHHRSRSIGSDYYSQPRVSASWDGDVVGFASNFNTPGSVDVYVVPFAPAEILPESSATSRAAPSGRRLVGGGPAVETGAVVTSVNRGPILAITPSAGGAGGSSSGLSDVPALSSPSPPLLQQRWIPARGIALGDEDELTEIVAPEEAVPTDPAGFLDGG